MSFFSQKFQSLYGKSFSYQIQLESEKIKQKFTSQAEQNPESHSLFSHMQGIFSYFKDKNSIHQLKNFVSIEWSSEDDSPEYSKENVLIRHPISLTTNSWKSKKEKNPWISFTFLLSEFSIEGYSISPCTLR